MADAAPFRPEVPPVASIIGDDIVIAKMGRPYSQLSGVEKRDYLFEQGIRPTAYERNEFPDVVGGEIQFTEAALQTVHRHSLRDTLTRASDEFDQPALKLFHTYGTTAKIKFIPEQDTPYTGIFQHGAPGLGRFSYAGPVSGVGVVPGLGLKFLIDGDHPSENLVVMRKLDSQQLLPFPRHHSVFQNPFTNILPQPVNPIMRIVKDAFETVVQPGQGLHQPADNLAAALPTGDPVPSTQIAAPFRLIFSATQKAKTASRPNVDFRDDLAQNIPGGSEIYEVFALDATGETELRTQGIAEVEELLPHAKKIGTIVTESEFIASAYGDHRLFFKHNANFIR